MAAAAQLAQGGGGQGRVDAALKTFRERALLTREQLAERLDYSHASVASVEQGRFRRMGRNSAGMPKRTRSTLVVVLLIWSLFAFPWFDKGCDIAEAYTAVIKYGVPEGLEPLPACYG